MGVNTRELVLDILLALEREEDYSHRLMKAVLDKYDYLEARDKASSARRRGLWKGAWSWTIIWSSIPASL